MSRHAMLLTFAAIVLLCASVYIAASLGNIIGGVTLELNWPSIWISGQNATLSSIIANLRVPRVLAAILAGGALAVSGLLLQGVSRNPLADPFLLGISGGAGLAVVIVNAFPSIITSLGWWVVPLAAFLGAQMATILVLSLARGSGGRVTMLGLILGGVIINSFCAAFTTFLLTRFEPLKMRITQMWLAGGVGYAQWNQLAIVAIVVIGSLVFIRIRAGKLNAFALGEEGASLVGVDSKALLFQTAWIASLLTGVAVSLTGLIGYIGLIVPHLVRLLVGADFRDTLFLTAFCGALILVVGDGAAKTVLSPQEIPVGVLAALIGTPMLLILIKRELGNLK